MKEKHEFVFHKTAFESLKWNDANMRPYSFWRSEPCGCFVPNTSRYNFPPFCNFRIDAAFKFQFFRSQWTQFSSSSLRCSVRCESNMGNKSSRNRSNASNHRLEPYLEIVPRFISHFPFPVLCRWWEKMDTLVSRFIFLFNLLGLLSRYQWSSDSSLLDF